MTDKFNQIETLAKDALAEDATLAGWINLFHEKLRLDVYSYYSHELPALGVYAARYQPADEAGRLAEVNLVVEIVGRGGDVAAVDGTVKQIASRVVDLLWAQSPVRGGRGFSPKLDGGGSPQPAEPLVEEVEVGAAEIVQADPESSQYSVSAIISVNVRFIE